MIIFIDLYKILGSILDKKNKFCMLWCAYQSLSSMSPYIINTKKLFFWMIFSELISTKSSDVDTLSPPLPLVLYILPLLLIVITFHVLYWLFPLNFYFLVASPFEVILHLLLHHWFILPCLIFFCNICSPCF